jgi:hypothetical protein
VHEKAAGKRKVRLNPTTTDSRSGSGSSCGWVCESERNEEIIRSHFYDPSKSVRKFAGICFVDPTRDVVLLGLKKKGFGTGIWQHSMAGKAEGNEAPRETAVREANEEARKKME